MGAKKKLIAVVPAYNEEGNIKNTIAELKKFHPKEVDFDFVIVDDGSTDHTKEISLDQKVHLVSLSQNMGIGVCVQTGFLYALKHNADMVAQVDGDGQHIAVELNKLIPLIQNNEADVVIGTRFADGQKNGLASTTLMRWIAGRLLAWTVRLLTKKTLTDTTSGFRIFNKRAALFVATEYPDDYPEAEILVILVKEGYHIKEVPVEMRMRQSGDSSINWWRSVYYIIKVMFSLILRKIRK